MTATELETWLIERIAAETGQPAQAIETNIPFARLGLDSAAAVGLTGELEELLKLTIDPTIVFEEPTIQRLAKHLAKQIQADAANQANPANPTNG